MSTMDNAIKIIAEKNELIEALRSERDKARGALATSRAQVAAWAALARAERRDHGAARFGTDAEKSAAFAQVQAARAALIALGIDPDEEPSHA